MSDQRLRDVERAYRAGAASRAEWVSALARVQPLRVELAAYCRDEDALAACGAPAEHDTDPHLWATTLPHVVKAAGMEWPAREVEVRAALVLATVAAHAWCTLACERMGCIAPETGTSGHLHSLHFDEVLPALNWAERTIAGRTSWRRLAREGCPFGLAPAWIDGERPLSYARLALNVVASRVPGQPLSTLVNAAAAVARWRARHEPLEDLARARAHLLDGFPDRLAADLGPWVLGDRDPVRERLASRGQRPVSA